MEVKPEEPESQADDNGATLEDHMRDVMDEFGASEMTVTGTDIDGNEMSLTVSKETPSANEPTDEEMINKQEEDLGTLGSPWPTDAEWKEQFPNDLPENPAPKPEPPVDPTAEDDGRPKRKRNGIGKITFRGKDGEPLK